MDEETWKYIRSFVADGNFTCLHRKHKNEGDINLSNGTGFTTETTRYAAHVKEAKDSIQVHILFS
jgi:hypothetical protein